MPRSLSAPAPFSPPPKLSPRDQGAEAYLEGISVDDNPFPTGGIFHHDWTFGWRNAAAHDPLSDDAAETHELQADVARTAALRLRRELQAGAPTVDAAARKIGIPAARWPGNCQAVAMAFVKAGVVAGDAVYGHYLGAVAPGTMFHRKPLIHHGWIDLGEGIVCDPTRWVFEGRKPYVYLGTGEDYDEGGQEHLGRMAGPAPTRQPGLPATTLSAPDEALERVALLFGRPAKAFDGVLDRGQIFWLANLPIATLEPHAAEIYRALEAAGLQAAIPFDNRAAVFRAEARSRAGTARRGSSVKRRPAAKAARASRAKTSAARRAKR